MDGVEVIRALRTWSTVPIVVLSGRMDSHEKVNALDAGADDYVTKPFSVEELLARLRAAHPPRPCRSASRSWRSASCGSICRSASWTVDGKPVTLTPTSTNCSACWRDEGRLLTHRTLLREVWGPGVPAGKSQYLHVYVSHLRRKIEPDPVAPAHLLTESGVGYRLVNPR